MNCIELIQNDCIIMVIQRLICIGYNYLVNSVGRSDHVSYPGSSCLALSRLSMMRAHLQCLVDGDQAVIVEKVLLDMVPSEDSKCTPEESLELIDKFVADPWFQAHCWSVDLFQKMVMYWWPRWCTGSCNIHFCSTSYRRRWCVIISLWFWDKGEGWWLLGGRRGRLDSVGWDWTCGLCHVFLNTKHSFDIFGVIAGV